MSMIKRKPLVYDDGMTKQSFKDSTDINKLLARAQVTGTLSHLEKHEGVYGDFSDFDFFEANQMLARGKSIFEELPSEIRKEFNQSPAEFFAFVNDPKNAGKLKEVLPELAAPGRQRIQLNHPELLPNQEGGEAALEGAPSGAPAEEAAGGTPASAEGAVSGAPSTETAGGPPPAEGAGTGSPAP